MLMEHVSGDCEHNELRKDPIPFDGGRTCDDRLSPARTISLLGGVFCIALCRISKGLLGSFSMAAALLDSIPWLGLAGGSHRPHRLWPLATALGTSDFPDGEGVFVTQARRAHFPATARTSLPCDHLKQPYEFLYSSLHETFRWIAGRFFNAPVLSG